MALLLAREVDAAGMDDGALGAAAVGTPVR
jgi:hypothetical protein